MHCNNKLLVSEKCLCDNCWNIAKISSPNSCPFCNKPQQSLVCNCNGFKESTLSGIISGWIFENPIDTIVHNFKYNSKNRLAKTCGKKLYNRIIEHIMPNIDIVTFVPIHHSKLRERGYNQSQLIAKTFSKKLNNCLCCKTLKKIKYGNTQTHFSREKRKENIKDSFYITQHTAKLINSKNIILIDDVVTTGATIGECSKTLIANGAKNVYAVTFARAEL